MSDSCVRRRSTYEESLSGVDKAAMKTGGNGGGGRACRGCGRARGWARSSGDRTARTKDGQELHEGEVSILREVVDVENERGVPVVPRVLYDGSDILLNLALSTDRIGNTPSGDRFTLGEINASLDNDGVVDGGSSVDFKFRKSDIDTSTGKLDKSRADLGSELRATLSQL